MSMSKIWASERESYLPSSTLCCKVFRRQVTKPMRFDFNWTRPTSSCKSSAIARGSSSHPCSATDLRHSKHFQASTIRRLFSASWHSRTFNFHSMHIQLPFQGLLHHQRTQASWHPSYQCLLIYFYINWFPASTERITFSSEFKIAPGYFWPCQVAALYLLKWRSDFWMELVACNRSILLERVCVCVFDLMQRKVNE